MWQNLPHDWVSILDPGDCWVVFIRKFFRQKPFVSTEADFHFHLVVAGHMLGSPAHQLCVVRSINVKVYFSITLVMLETFN